MIDKTVLVTGGAGFIGRHLVRALARDNDVFVVDNLYRHPRPPRWPARLPRVHFLRADVLDRAALASFVPAGVTHVVHLAAVAGVRTVRRDPLRALRANLQGSLEVISLAERCRHLERFLLLSSSEVYGPQAGGAEEEGWPVGFRLDEPRWTYAAAKIAAEALTRELWNAGALPATVVRPFNVYGPHQIGEGAVRTFALRSLRGRPLRIRGSGRQRRAWCHVDDLVRGLRLALEEPRALGEVFNLGNPDAACSARELATLIRDLAGSSSPIVDVAPVFDDVEDRVPSIRKARARLGYEPRVGLREGLGRTVGWYERRIHASPGARPRS